jgi:phenylpropionate dioxygenase-like ring-hydroxylating dioxygenase large terminal subunit
MDDDCSHRGASLSDGHLCDNQVVCPYHAYEFDKKGTLVKIPGLNFTNTPCKNQKTYAIIEKNGWVYINTKMTPMDILRFPRETQFLFEEP